MAGVKQISKISSIIQPYSSDQFAGECKKPLTIECKKDFDQAIRGLIQSYPQTEGFFSWWLQPIHAQILFTSQKGMSQELWDSLPATTNVEESLHWKFYTTVGKDHASPEGICALYQIAQTMEAKWMAAQVGVPIRYGEAQPWKKFEQAIGRTKLNPVGRSRNWPKRTRTNKKLPDGCAPDTINALAKANKGSKSPQKSPKNCKHTSDDEKEDTNPEKPPK